MQDDAGSATALAPAPGPVLGSDPHGFAGLYIRHRSSFTSHARRYLRDPRDADEVVQEAFLRLFLAMPELETELQALAYCRRTITNLCIDRYRADARRPRLVALEGPTVDELADDDTGDPVVRAEDAALVRAALSQLPELHRAALVKREIEEKPLPLIADELDVAEDSVKHLLFRARRSLRKLLAGTSVAPGVDAELTRGLRPLSRGASGGAAGLLLLALLGLGSGPDLRAVPVVGVDLPDVLGVTAVAEAVSGAVRDVVDALVPGESVQDGPRAQDPASRPVSRSQALSPAQAPAATSQTASGVAVATTSSRRAPVPAPGPVGSRPTTTVVTMVDGVQVVTVVPAPDAPASAPVGLATAPGTSLGGAAVASLPAPVGPQVPGDRRDLLSGMPPAPVIATTKPAGSDTVRSPRAADVATRAADKAADTAEKAERATERIVERAAEKAPERTADRAADLLDKAQDKVDRTRQHAAEKVQEAVARAAEKAERTDRAAEKAAARAAAERAEERAAAQRAAAQAAAAQAAAAQAAAAQAAAAQAAAAASAQQAAAAASTVVGTTVSSVVGAVAPAAAP